MIQYNAQDLNTEVHPAELLRHSGLRPTQQRMAIVSVLYKNGHRHISAEDLHTEILSADTNVSLATVYNTLNQMVSAGLLKVLMVDADRRVYDTDTTVHSHFYFENEDKIIDAPSLQIRDFQPNIPEGYEVQHIDVVVRLKKIEH